MVGFVQHFGAALGASGATPSVPLPMAPLAPPQANQNAELARAIRSIEALFGRVIYDAGPSWTRFSSYPATDFSPDKIVTAQREADAGYPLRWAEMDEQVRERDAHLGGIALTRAQDVAGKAVRISRVGDDDLASSLKSLCDEVVFSIDSLDDAFESLLLGNAPGWSSSEIVYVEDEVSFAGPDGRRIGPIPLIVPRRLETIHPKHFTFDLRTDEPYLWLGGDRQSLPSAALRRRCSRRSQRARSQWTARSPGQALDGIYTHLTCVGTVAVPSVMPSRDNPHAGTFRGQFSDETALPFKRLLTFTDGDALTKARADDRARWKANRGKFDSFVAEYTAMGHSLGGVLFAPDSMCVHDVHGPFYISARRFMRNASVGTVTPLMLHKPGLLAA
jgi:hypothetical protein